MTLAERAARMRLDDRRPAAIISHSQLALHKRSEALALVSGPVLIFIGICAPVLWVWARVLLVVLGVGTFAVDAWLLAHWKTIERPT
jgi:hypothetical protein